MVIPFCKHHAEQVGEASVRKRWATVRCQPLERSQHTQKFSVSRVVRNSDVSITIHHDSQLEQVHTSKTRWHGPRRHLCCPGPHTCRESHHLHRAHLWEAYQDLRGCWRQRPAEPGWSHDAFRRARAGSPTPCFHTPTSRRRFGYTSSVGLRRGNA